MRRSESSALLVRSVISAIGSPPPSSAAASGPAFCLAYDVIAAGFLAWLLYQRKLDKAGQLS